MFSYFLMVKTGFKIDERINNKLLQLKINYRIVKYFYSITTLFSRFKVGQTVYYAQRFIIERRINSSQNFSIANLS